MPERRVHLIHHPKLFDFGNKKRCARCREFKEAPEFPQSTDTIDRIGIYCRACHKVKFGEYMDKWGDVRRRRANARTRKIREEMIAAYGSACACCGESRFEFLAIDHVYGGGYKERKRFPGPTLYRHLRKRGWPKDGYRLLCHNCNMSSGFHGFCPHETETPAYGFCVGG